MGASTCGDGPASSTADEGGDRHACRSPPSPAWPAAAGDVRGAFNIAAEPVLDSAELADIFGARTVRVSQRWVRAAIAAAWGLHLLPASPGLFDLAMEIPVMDTARARTELGWTPRHSAREAFTEFLEGLRTGAGREP